MNCQPHFRLPRAPWWVDLALAAALPVRAEVTCDHHLLGGGTMNPAVPATTPTRDFILHDDGTVTHTLTGLMWMRCSLGTNWTGTTCTTDRANRYNWQNALNAAQTLNASGGYAGHVDWRLPNKNELASIAEERCSPGINAMIFPETPWVSWHWSSSPSSTGSGAWGVGFYSVGGMIDTHSMGIVGGAVLLVRDAQSGLEDETSHRP